MKLLRCVSVILFLCFVCPLSAFANTWAKAYEVTESVHINPVSTQVTSEGDYIVAGEFEDHNGDKYASVLRLNEQGDIVWHKSYTANGIDDIRVSTIRQISDQKFVLAGHSGSGAFWIIKLDEDGNIILSNSYGGVSSRVEVSDIQEISDGGLIAVVNIVSACWVIKLEKNGNIVWQKKYAGAIPTSIQETMDGGFIVAGSALLERSVLHMVLRLDRDGNVIWQKRQFAEFAGWLNTVKTTSDNGFIVGGGSHGHDGKSTGTISKLDHNGNIVWRGDYGNGFWKPNVEDIQKTSDGMFIAVGSIGHDILVLKFDTHGNIFWQKVYGTHLNIKWPMNARSVGETPDGGYIVAGTRTNAISDASDTLVLKLDRNGNIDQCDLSKDLNIGYDVTFEHLSYNEETPIVDTQATIQAFSIESQNINALSKSQCSGIPANSETNCKDGIDNNNDGLTDCEDPDCYNYYHHHCSGKPYLYENFDGIMGPNDPYYDLFVYRDDIFNETHQASYASGFFSSGTNNSTGLHVILGGKDGKDILDGISGGWISAFGSYEATDVIIGFDYRMATTMFDADECAQVLVRLDDGPVEVLDEACGRGIDTGWQTGKILKFLEAGSHSLALGGFVNKKTGPQEKADIYFDNIYIIEAGAVASTCSIDLENSSHSCQHIPAIDFLLEPEDEKVVLRINLDPDQSGFTEALFDVQYHSRSEGWTVNIGDSISNDGFKGDGADQSNDAEMQIKDGVMSVYGSDLTPEGNHPLLNLSGVMNASSQIRFKVKNQFLRWSCQERTGELRSPFLYALDGQPDTEGPVNYDIYAAFNRTIGNASRKGSGVGRINLRLNP